MGFLYFVVELEVRVGFEGTGDVGEGVDDGPAGYVVFVVRVEDHIWCKSVIGECCS